MSEQKARRGHAIAAACVAAVLLVTAADWPSAASLEAGPGPQGTWAVRVDLAVGPIPEAIIGVLSLEKDGTCTLGVRSSFAGLAHDHTEATGPVERVRDVDEPCTWSPPGAHVDGVVTVYGLAEPGPVELSFVLAENGQRLLLLLDGTHPGITGTGEGFRR